MLVALSGSITSASIRTASTSPNFFALNRSSDWRISVCSLARCSCSGVKAGWAGVVDCAGDGRVSGALDGTAGGAAEAVRAAATRNTTKDEIALRFTKDNTRAAHEMFLRAAARTAAGEPSGQPR